MNIDKYFEQGRELIPNKQFPDALSIYGKALASCQTRKERAELHYLKGCMHMFTDGVGAPQVKQELETALELFPRHAGAGLELVNLQRFAEGRLFEKVHSEALWKRLVLRTLLPLSPERNVCLFDVDSREWGGSEKLSLDSMMLQMEWLLLSKTPQQHLMNYWLSVPHPAYSGTLLAKAALIFGISSLVPNEVILKTGFVDTNELSGFERLRFLGNNIADINDVNTLERFKRNILSVLPRDLKKINKCWKEVHSKLGYTYFCGNQFSHLTRYTFSTGKEINVRGGMEKKAKYPLEKIGPSLLSKDIPSRGAVYIEGSPFYQYCTVGGLELKFSQTEITLTRHEKYPYENIGVTISGYKLEPLSILSSFIVQYGSERFLCEIRKTQELAGSKDWSKQESMWDNYAMQSTRDLEIARERYNSLNPEKINHEENKNSIAV